MTAVEPGRFVFVTCQVGAERTLKAELGREHAELRFAFSRPGFVTFKLADAGAPLAPDFALRSVFARAHGLSLGAVGTAALPVEERARLVLQLLRERARPEPDPARRPRAAVALHLWERDRWLPGEEPPGCDAGRWAARAIEAVRAQAAAQTDLSLDLNTPARPGQLVHDLVLVEEDSWWSGMHRHTPGHSPHPGGRPQLTLPVEAPSRAYLKLEEGLQWCGAVLQPGDSAVEIGSAPGGACFALLQRGLQVVGIDPAAMDARVLGLPRFVHLARSVDAVRWEDLPHPVHWLLLDMNVPPRQALRALRRLLPVEPGGLLGLLLTLKLNQWRLADQIPGIIGELRKLGMQRVGARQLASNRREVFAYGLTAAGLARHGGQPQA